MPMQKITPFLWFDSEAEEAAAFYTSLFEGSQVRNVTRYSEAGPGAPGSAMTVEFELAGQQYIALNGGPEFPFTEAVSLQVACQDQAEVDRLWDALTEGGDESQCGWLKDRYGLSWQIVPTRLPELIGDPDPGRSQRAMKAMLGMKKIDVAAMEAAADAG
jgi:predicted 3-demethylubiquinone-9 3-methyltransferase (glyoxalase superfamily)